MTNKEYVKRMNWTIFILVVVTAIITAGITLNDLYHPSTSVEETQSRVGFRWGSLHITISLIMLIVSVFLAMAWKRLFPFNVPIAIILVGFCYELFFLTFTIGWVGVLGMLGFMIAFLIGVILMIYYTVSNYMERRKTLM